ncbi:MAG TPA: DUF883 domain-containing protein [Roseiarcus sp.]|nr:DUF883 domain-containing protein [Roseiarcus sp.]
MTSDFPSGGERTDGARDIGDENAFARPEKEMAAMKNAIGDLSDQITDAASDIGAAAQEQARRGLKHARANVGAIASDASDRLGAVADTVQSQASSLGGSFEDVVRERPLSTVALALGLGFLFGVIWRR